MDYYEKVKEKDQEFAELEARMIQDTDLLYLKKYVMKDKTGKHAIPDIINSTLNKPAVFFANVTSSLGNVKQQCVVDSDKRSFDTHFVEDCLDSAIGMANAYNRKRKLPNLNQAADINFCARGRHGRRILFRMGDDGKVVPDIVPWDGRYIRYEVGDNGLKWASYKTLRTRDQIEQEYGVVIKTLTETVLDIWDDEHNEVWVGNREVVYQPHGYGFTPVVFNTVSLGYGDALMDDVHLKNEGESIFFLIRDVIPQLNMILSILQTLNFMSVKSPQQYVSKEGKEATPPEYDEVIQPGAMTSVDAEGGIKRIDFGDATKAAEMAYNMIEKAVQEGSYTDVDIGNAQQPFSAIALITIGESRDQLFMPRLAAKEEINTDTAEMIIQQLMQIGGTVNLGMQGHERPFNTGKLDGEYSVDYKYFVKSPKIDVVRMAIADQAAKWYPRSYVYKEVLQVEDPKGMKDEWYSQQAEMVDPNILKHRIIMNLLDLAEKGDENAGIEAAIMVAGMGIEQIKAGIISKPQPAPSVSGESPVPLLGKGGQVGGIMPKPGVPQLTGGI